jgi:hypothetical protein
MAALLGAMTWFRDVKAGVTITGDDSSRAPNEDLQSQIFPSATA